MKRVILSLSLASLLYAGVGYDSALESFNSGKFDDAYKKFNELFKSNLDNPKINYYLGRSAYEVGKYDDAVNAFERVLIVDENHLKSKLELARVYLKLGQVDLAKEQFLLVLEKNPPKEIKDNINSILSSIESSRDRDVFSLFLSIEGGYDDNINSTPTAENILDYLSNVYKIDDAKAEPIIDSGFIQESLSANYSYDFMDSGGFVLDTRGVIYNQNYFKNSDFDILYANLSFAPSYLYKNHKFSLPITVEKLIYGGDDLMLLSSISANYVTRVDKYIFGSYFKFQQKDFEEDKAKNSYIKEFSLGVNRLFENANLGFNYTLYKEDKKSANEATFVDRTSQSIRIGGSIAITSEYIFDLTYILKNTMYEDMILNQKRDDIHRNLISTLSYRAWDFGTLFMRYNYINDSSNYKVVEYDKNSYTIGINLNF